MYTVKQITRKECETYILGIHYAHRWPSITWAFGLFTSEDKELCGVVTYGTPPSSTLRRFIAGDENERYVIELNRLCLKYNRKNEASILVGRSIKLLPKNKLIVSYADSEQDHVGYVYQATNFLYTGLSTKGSVWKVRGKEHLHNITLLDEFRGVPNRTDKLREKYGDDLFREDNSRKHRYIYLHGDRKFKKRIMLALTYKIRDYPKGINSIKELENKFSKLDNVSNCESAETISSADFDDIILPHTGEVSRAKRPTTSGEGPVRFRHPDFESTMQSEKYCVKRITRQECEPYLLHIHYAKRMPMMSYPFGLFYEDELCGVVTYGETSSMPLRVNIAGVLFEPNIIELTRLCLKYNRKNEASLLVGRSIKMLPKNKIIVSFADMAQDHVGCVYQATNFVYTGLSTTHKALKLRGRENAHELTILAEFKGQENMREKLQAKYGDRIYFEQSSRKHRYIYFHGDRKFKKAAQAALKHKLRDFPRKGESAQDIENKHRKDDNIENLTEAETLSSESIMI